MSEKEITTPVSPHGNSSIHSQILVTNNSPSKSPDRKTPNRGGSSELKSPKDKKKPKKRKDILYPLPMNKMPAPLKLKMSMKTKKWIPSEKMLLNPELDVFIQQNDIYFMTVPMIKEAVHRLYRLPERAHLIQSHQFSKVIPTLYDLHRILLNLAFNTGPRLEVDLLV